MVGINEDFQGLVEELKRQYGEIYSTELDGHVFIYRPLSRFEYLSIDSMDIDPGTKEELTCLLCVVYPEDFDWSSKAGYASTISDNILEVSGMASPEQAVALLAEAREEMQDLLTRWMYYPQFSEIPIEEIPHWTFLRPYGIFPEPNGFWLICVA